MKTVILVFGTGSEAIKMCRFNILTNFKEQTIKFVRSIRHKAKAEKAEWEYVPNAETRAAIEECESGADLATLNITNFKDYVKSL